MQVNNILTDWVDGKINSVNQSSRNFFRCGTVESMISAATFSSGKSGCYDKGLDVCMQTRLVVQVSFHLRMPDVIISALHGQKLKLVCALICI